MNNRPLIVVSGLPRSGTSLMMASLQAGGLELLTDSQRQPDDHNPKGYFEHEGVLRLKDSSKFLEGQSGKAVKIIYKLLQQIPKQIPLKVLFMERDLAEVIASQNKMLQLQQSPEEMNEVSRLFSLEVDRCKRWLAQQSNIQTLYVQHAQLLEQPEQSFAAVAEFLDRELDVPAMGSLVDPSLHRQKSQPNGSASQRGASVYGRLSHLRNIPRGKRSED